MKIDTNVMREASPSDPAAILSDYNPELEAYFDVRQRPVLRVLEDNIGNPIARRDWVEALPDGKLEARERRITRIVAMFSASPLAHQLLRDERYPRQYHYLLLAENQDREKAAELLHTTTDALIKTDASVLVRDRHKVRLEQLQSALAQTIDPTTVVDIEEAAITRHLQRQVGREFDPEPVAKCTSVDSRFFYPKKGGSTLVAKLLCGQCALKDHCLVDRFDDSQGVAGGLSQMERQRLRKMLYDEVIPAGEVAMLVSELRLQGFEAARAAYQSRGFSAPDVDLASA